MTTIRPAGDPVANMNKYSKFGRRRSTIGTVRCCLRVTLHWACMSCASGPARGDESAANASPHAYFSLAANQLFNQPVFSACRAPRQRPCVAYWAADRSGREYVAMQRAVVERTLQADRIACARLHPSLSHTGMLESFLVSRFRRSYHFAARTFTNVGTKGTPATL